jgi:hypothetical protein
MARSLRLRKPGPSVVAMMALTSSSVRMRMTRSPAVGVSVPLKGSLAVMPRLIVQRQQARRTR